MNAHQWFGNLVTMVNVFYRIFNPFRKEGNLLLNDTPVAECFAFFYILQEWWTHLWLNVL